MAEYTVCALDDLADPGSFGFEIQLSNGDLLSGFLVRKGGEIFGYRNQCPHLGTPLDWQPHQFLDIENSFIQCATHGALFQISDGHCLRGPCAGDRLKPLNILSQQGMLFLKLDQA